jgi:hypothetical protein
MTKVTLQIQKRIVILICEYDLNMTSQSFRTTLNMDQAIG